MSGSTHRKFKNLSSISPQIYVQAVYREHRYNFQGAKIQNKIKQRPKSAVKNSKSLRDKKNTSDEID